MVAAFTYDINIPRGPRVLSRGWSADAIFHARTGFPMDVLAAETYNGLDLANVIRPSLVPGIPVWLADPNAPGARRLNPMAFSIPNSALQGDLGRNAIRGFGMSQLDVALRRTIAIGDRTSLQLRLEASNLLNQADFADPRRHLSSPFFGQSTSMLNLMLGSGTPHSGLTPAYQLGGPRMLQLSLRFQF